MEEALKKYDEEKLRCRMLGDFVPFMYCRKMNEKLPCKLIINCWQQKLPILDFLNENFSKDELTKCFKQDDRSRIEKIHDLVAKATEEK